MNLAVIDFFVDNFPPLHIWVIGGPIGFLWAYLCLTFAGYLKIHRGMKTGYTRKVFHFLIFFSVACISRLWGLPAVCLFGVMASLVIFYAIIRGNGHPLYEAMAREKDEPHRTYYIIAPYFATLIGGIGSNILFGPNAVFGYLVAGLGDAIGEPVGTRFGKHRYKVLTLSKVNSTRSYEGSFAIFLISMLAFGAGITMRPDLSLQASHLLVIPLAALGSAVVEAVSPHGWDNATMQIIPAFVASVLL